MGCSLHRTPNGVMIVCGRNREQCRVSPGCRKAATLLCDWPIGDGKTCDRPMCANHSRQVWGPNNERKDFCVGHPRS